MSNQPQARPACDHHWITKFQQDIGLNWIRQCSQCGDFDADDLREQITKIETEGAPTTTLKVASFINERPRYVEALKASPEADSDYFRWQGHAEARRQLATFLGWTVPHESGEHTTIRTTDPTSMEQAAANTTAAMRNSGLGRRTTGPHLHFTADHGPELKNNGGGEPA